MQNIDNEKQVQSVQIILLQGIHFYNLQQYFEVMRHNISLLCFLKTIRVSIINQKDKYTKILKCQRNSVIIFIREVRIINNGQINYCLDYSQDAVCKEENKQAFKLVLISQQRNEHFNNRSLIRIIIKRYSQTSQTRTVFEQLVAMGSVSSVFKPNYCKFVRYNQLTYPNMNLHHSSENKFILIINQTNLRELPFYVGAIEEAMKTQNISKIIGHPSSIFLLFLINQQGTFNNKAKQLILNHKPYQRQKYKPQQDYKVKKQQILKGILFNMLSQQNIFNPNLIQFLADNIVNKQFTTDFISLVELYYKVFLKEDLSRQEIQCAIYNYFYYQKQKIQKYAFSFSNIFNLIEYKHNLHCNNLIHMMLKHMPSSLRGLQQLTLQDLYNYNKVQYTFIALDLSDKVVRFFNYTTTPRLPVCAILSLVQFLPTPYKSILWREEWGRYRINYGSQTKQINISNHQIIDSRFLLQCPLDLLEDKDLRKCYMSGSNDCETIHAISIARKKVQQLHEIEQLKTLLKSIKANAIDSIPKLRLLWKILTTKNKIDLDLNNFQSFHQIPLLSRVIHMDETFKVYLQNLNRQANSNKILKCQVHILHSGNLQVNSLSKNMTNIKTILSQLLKSKYEQRNKQQLMYDLNEIQKEISNCPLRGYQSYLYVINLILNIVKNYPIENKCIYSNHILSIAKYVNAQHQTLHYQIINQQITQTITSLKSAHFLPNYQLSNTIVKQKLSLLLNEFEKEEQTFKEQTNVQRELVYEKYQKKMYRACRQLCSIMEDVKQTQSINKLYYQLYKITPFFFKIEDISKFKFIQDSQTKSFLNILNSYNKVHLILNGQPYTLLQLSHKLITTRNHLKQLGKTQISHITATNHHSIAAILFAIGIQDQALIEQLVGIEQLVKINNANLNEDQFDLVDLLLNKKQYDEEDQEKERAHELYLKIGLKYKNAFKLLICLQDQYFIKVQDLYQVIHQYDQEHDSLPIEFKQKEIVMFLQQLINNQCLFLKKAELIIQNKDMIADKLKTNKIGIRFIIRFLYRSIEKEANWFNIHKSKYKTLHHYKTYLKQLFHKYNIDQKIILSSFNKTNHSKIEVNFVLANYYKNKYQVFSSKEKGYVKLIDLILASLAVPVDFPNKPISIKQVGNKEKISLIINKSVYKFTQQYKQESYWSNFGNNSTPFNILQAQQQDTNTFYCSFQFIPHTGIQVDKKIHQSKIKNSNLTQQTYNLRAIDLLSMWWAKNKKLTPQLKEIIFGSIFQSPFLYYYYIVQNSSYEALLSNRQKRSLIDLSCNQEDLYLKGRIIGHQFFAESETSLIIRIRRRLDCEQLQIQLLRIHSKLQIKVQSIGYLQQGQVYKCDNNPQLTLSLYYLRQQSLQEYTISWNNSYQIEYYKILVRDKQLQLTTLSQPCLKTKLAYKNKSYILNFPSCGSFQQIECQKCSKTGAIRGNINLFLLAHQSYLSDYNELKSKVMDEVRQSATIKNRKTKLKQSYFCLLCCFAKPNQEDSNQK